jgi:putative SOS response-associated peptidase YedK
VGKIDRNTPTSGFYEWTGPKAGREPHCFTRQDDKIIGFARLWDLWKNRHTGEDDQTTMPDSSFI